MVGRGEEETIQGRDNRICKGLGARESLVHVAKLRSSIRLAHSLVSRRDAAWGWREERQGLDLEALVLMSLPPSQTFQPRVPRMMQAGLGEGDGTGPYPPCPCGAAGCQLGSLTQEALFPHAKHVTSGNDQNSFALAKRLVLCVCSLVSECNSCCF